MFTLDQIKAAHAKVKSGADFPAYIQELKALGLVRYVHHVADGRMEYEGLEAFALSAPAKWEEVLITANGSEAALTAALSAHQQGQTDYPTFCRDAAAAGVKNWVVDMLAMTCTYHDAEGGLMLCENIPVQGQL